MWQVVRELSTSLGCRYAADHVCQLPSGQDITDACRLEVTGNLSKARLDCKSVFLLMYLGMGCTCKNPSTTCFIQRAMGLLLLSCCPFWEFWKCLKNGSLKRLTQTILPLVSWFIKERPLSVSLRAIQKTMKIYIAYDLTPQTAY